MKSIIVTFCSLLLLVGCTHLGGPSAEEKHRAYIFDLDRPGDSWPRDFSLDTKPTDKSPEVIQEEVPAEIQGNILKSAHKQWVIKGHGKWMDLR